MNDLGLEVETLEESLHVSSSLGTRVRVDQICWACELEISGILLTMDLKVIDMSEFNVILGTSWSTAHRVGGLLPTDWMKIVLCFKGISTTLYPEPCTTLGGTSSLWVSWQALP